MVTNLLPEDPDHQLARALDAMAELVEGVRDQQWALPTPCPGWSVRDVLEHVVRGQDAVVAVVHGRPAPDGEVLGDDGLAALRGSGEALRGALAQPGVLDRLADLLGRDPRGRAAPAT